MEDKYFSEEKFLSWVRDVFIKLQDAWTKRDWHKMRPFESNELFEQHSAQLQQYIDSNKINVVERINIQFAEIAEHKYDGDKELLVVNLQAVMNDYIIDATTSNSGSSGVLITLLVYAIPITLFPLFCKSVIFSGICALLFSNSLSGAPITTVPIFSKEIALHFLSDENGIFSMVLYTVSPLKCFFIALNVALLSSIPFTNAVIISLNVFGSISSLYIVTSDTFIFPVVIVPVLSKHMVSICAKDSILYNSCTSTCFFANLITPDSNEIVINKTNPFGNIPK